jgi:predicted aspartyl protease
MRSGVRAFLFALCVVLTCIPMACLRAPGPDGSAVSNASSSADAEVRDFRLRDLAARVQAAPPGIEHDYLAGILAGRSGRSDEAVRLLTGVLPALRESQPQRMALALEALADTYSTTYRYRDAARVHDELARYASYLPLPVDDDAALARILAEAPPQTIESARPVRLKTVRNPIGSVNAAVTVNGVTADWLLDTGANYSVVSRDLAEKAGLTRLAGTGMVGAGVTGLKSPIEAAIVPRIVLGGATIDNVVVVILDAANLKVGPQGSAYQIDAILGYPVLRALGRVTFTSQGEFLAGETAQPAANGARMFVRGLAPAIECDVDGEPLLFTFDTGASSTNFSVRYYERFRERATSWRTRTVENGGAGGNVRREMFVQPAVELKVAGTPVTLSDVSIFSTRMNAGIDVLFGNLGQDFVSGFESFTLDFENMTFALGRPIASPATR